MSAEFADTNIVLYLLDDGPKADRAEVILGQGPRISVQVLNEATVNCRRKAGVALPFNLRRDAFGDNFCP